MPDLVGFFIQSVEHLLVLDVSLGLLDQQAAIDQAGEGFTGQHVDLLADLQSARRCRSRWRGAPGYFLRFSLVAATRSCR